MNVTPRSVPPRSVPPRSVPPRSVPPRSVPPRSVPPRSVPPRSVPPRSVTPRSVALVGLALLASAGCTQRPEPIEPVTVGLLVPEGSESLGAIAQAWKQAAILAQEQINAAGGLYDGRPMVLEIRDTEASATIAADAMRELIEADVVGVIGPATSGESLATRDLAAAAEIPQISCCATSVEVTAEQSQRTGWFFRTTAHDRFQGGAIGYLASQGFRGPHPVYQAATGATEGASIDSCTDMIIVERDDSYGASLAGAIEDAFAAAPISYYDSTGTQVPRVGGNGQQVQGNVLGRFKFTPDFVGGRNPGSAEVVSEAQGFLRGSAAGYEDNGDVIARINSDYDFETNGGVCVVLAAYPTEGGATLRAVNSLLDAVDTERQMTDPGFELRRTYLAADGLANDDFAGAAGALVQQVQGTNPSHAYNEAYDEFFTAYDARFGEAPPSFTSQVFDAVILMALAITQAGADDGPLVRDALFDVSAGGTVYQGKFFGEMANAILADQDIDYIGPSGYLDFDDKGDVTSDYALWKGAVVQGSDPLRYTAVGTDQLPFDEFNE
jgi:ABC-type branched-subunit amino acid transport system substrate-binding protein